MKKLLSVIMSGMIVTGMSFGTLAASDSVITQSSQEKSGTINIGYDLGVTYTVTIPASVTFTDTEKTVERSLLASDVFINEGNTLSVKVSSLNDFKMKNGDGYIDYDLKVNQNPVTDQNDFNILTVKAGDNTGWAILNFETDLRKDNAVFAGNYTDMLTFTVSVV